MMNRNKFTLLAAATLLLSAAGTVNAEEDAAEATIRLMGEAEAELPAAVTKSIELPARLLDAPKEEQVKAVEKAEKGLASAKENRGNGVGRKHSDDARNHGEDMRDEAKDNRESRGRSDPPGRPDKTPGPPAK